jgi:hypothetical protein
MSLFTYVCTCTYIYVFIYICMYVYIHMLTYVQRGARRVASRFVGVTLLFIHIHTQIFVYIQCAYTHAYAYREVQEGWRRGSWVSRYSKGSAMPRD